jgi:pilus assembly protein CpaB
MRARTLILLIVALVLAGGTTMLARAWLASQRAAPAEAAPVALKAPSKSVLVARIGVQRGQLLKPDDLIWEPWPDGGVDKNYVLIGTRTPESFAGWVARYPLAAGEPIIEAKIVAPGNRGFLAAVLRPGMRAVSVPINLTTGISGFVFPGDQVDLLVTYAVQETPREGDTAPPGPLLEHKVSETVLRNVRVIAIDQKTDSKAADPGVKNATLELTPKQTEIVELASEMGKLSLTLRSLVPAQDEVKQDSEEGSPDSLATPLLTTYTTDNEISPLIRNPFKANKKTDTGAVTILRGSQGAVESAATTQPTKAGGS